MLSILPRMKTIGCFVLIPAVCWNVVCMAQPMTLEGHQQELRTRQGALQKQRNLTHADIHAGYKRALEGLLADVMAEGELEKVELVREEMDRVAEKLSRPPNYSKLESLNRLQTTLKYLLTDANHEYGYDLVDLYAKYDESLQGQEVELVKANRIDDAVAVRSIRDALKEDLPLVQVQEWLPKEPVDKENRPELTNTWAFLSDLPEKQFKTGHGGLGRGNLLGYGRETKMKVGDRNVKKGISTHPPPNGKAFVLWQLESPATEFEAEVAINHTGIRSIATPVLFRLIGDGKVLWTSEPKGKNSKPQKAKVSLPNVTELRLEVECPGTHHAAHSIWVDPKVR